MYSDPYPTGSICFEGPDPDFGKACFKILDFDEKNIKKITKIG